MTRFRTLLAAAALFLVSSSAAHAVRMDGNPPMLPIATHAMGQAGTQWQTDLWVTNPTTQSFTFTLNFYPIGSGSPVPSGVGYAIGPESTVEFKDVVLTVFGLNNASGTIFALCPTENVLELRGRIYNVGNPAGQFGQFVPGFPAKTLYRRAYLAGLSGIEDNRLNVGVANPNAEALDVSVTLLDGNDHPLGGRTLRVEPYRVIQVNNVFGTWAIPPAGNVQVDMSHASTTCPTCPIYGYASVVRNDTGDASFIFGSSPGVDSCR